MKKGCLLFLLLAAVSALSVSSQYRAGYYDKMEGKSKEQLKKAAKECVQTHTRLDYTSLPIYWESTDTYPEKENGQLRWWEMYGATPYYITQSETALRSFSRNKMQREHSIPKSWWKKNNDVEYTPAYTDLWNLYPSDGPANQAKNNYPFGPTDKPTFNNGVTKVGPPRTGFGGGCGNVFEPADQYKGDFARTIFYMATVYDDLDWVYNYMFRKTEWPTLIPWAYEMLLQWARQDPVSQKEVDRNNAVEKCQGNRNPYIDFPELAEYIWGTRTTQKFYIADQGGTVTPPLTGDPELVYPTNGMALDFGQAATGSTVERELLIDGRNLTEPLSLRIVGANRSYFSVSETLIPAAEINSTDMYGVTVFYTPTAEGSHSATLSLYDGGLGLGKDVAVTLLGQGVAKPVLTAPVALPATNVTETGYVANWTESTEVVDYYEVNRVRYLSGNTVAETLVSDTNMLEITDRNASVMESYNVKSSRLGYLSEASNTIVVGAGSVVIGLEARQPLVIGTVDGGVVILGDEPQHNVCVYDMSGRIVARRAAAECGETIELPRGIYVVSSDAAIVPLKIAVR